MSYLNKSIAEAAARTVVATDAERAPIQLPLAGTGPAQRRTCVCCACDWAKCFCPCCCAK